MSTQTVIRNTDVLFETTFTDTADLPVAPTGVTLRVVYSVQGVLQTDELEMSDHGSGVWNCVWSNDTADTGIVQWCIIAAGTHHAADEGFFILVANAANPQTVEE